MQPTGSLSWSGSQINEVLLPKPQRYLYTQFLRYLLTWIILLILLSINLGIVLGKIKFDRVVSVSMQPTLAEGDELLSIRTSAPARYAVICLRNPLQPDENLVKRVIGLPGDHIEIRNGELFVNQQKEVSSQVSENIINWHNVEVDVPQGEYFVLGDNRNDSYDSLNFGTVPVHNVLGTVHGIVWPLSRCGRMKSFS